MNKELLTGINDFNTLDKLKEVFREQFQNKYDFELYLAPSGEELKKKFELLFLESEEPYEKLFDDTFLKDAFPQSYLNIPLTLYVYLGEDRETGLYRQTLAAYLTGTAK